MHQLVGLLVRQRLQLRLLACLAQPHQKHLLARLALLELPLMLLEESVHVLALHLQHLLSLVQLVCALVQEACDPKHPEGICTSVPMSGDEP
eukprot:4352657-Pyramimonas_sp.AAC.2